MANLVGIGGITAKIKTIIQKIRHPFDKAISKVIEFVAGKAKLILAKLTGGDPPKEEPKGT